MSKCTLYASYCMFNYRNHILCMQNCNKDFCGLYILATKKNFKVIFSLQREPIDTKYPCSCHCCRN